mgnify:CR=1 FL=1
MLLLSITLLGCTPKLEKKEFFKKEDVWHFQTGKWSKKGNLIHVVPTWEDNVYRNSKTKRVGQHDPDNTSVLNDYYKVDGKQLLVKYTTYIDDLNKKWVFKLKSLKTYSQTLDDVKAQ